MVYTEAVGQDLGIEGAKSVTRINVQDTQPQISRRLEIGVHPEIVWTKGNFDGIDIYEDRGNNTWIFLAADTHPPIIQILLHCQLYY